MWSTMMASPSTKHDCTGRLSTASTMRGQFDAQWRFGRPTLYPPDTPVAQSQEPLQTHTDLQTPDMLARRGFFLRGQILSVMSVGTAP
jgi:hypothetical protein